MADPIVSLASGATAASVPPPRRGRAARPRGWDAVPVLPRLGLLPLAARVVGPAALSQRRRPAGPRPRGRPRTYSGASILRLALLGRRWQLSTRELCAWLARWPALATAGGLPPGRVVHPAHLSRRVRRRGPYPCWLLYLALVGRAIRCGLIGGRDVALDSTLLTAWTPADPDAAWSFPSRKGRGFGYKVPVLLDRAARLPILCPLSPANRNDLPFAYPRPGLARWLFGLPLRSVRADGADWGRALVRFIVTGLRARPIIPFNRKGQPLARVRRLAWDRLSYAARAVIARSFGSATRHDRLDTAAAVGWAPALLRVTLTFCAIRVVALAAHQAGAPELRLPPTRVLAHYLPIQEVA